MVALSNKVSCMSYGLGVAFLAESRLKHVRPLKRLRERVAGCRGRGRRIPRPSVASPGNDAEVIEGREG
jgi:hypothetical protein